MKQTFNDTICDTETATLLGRNPRDHLGRSCYLYRTPEVTFFMHRTTMLSRASDVLCTIGTGLYTDRHEHEITPLSVDDAKDEYKRLKKHCLDYAEAFSNIEFTRA